MSDERDTYYGIVQLDGVTEEEAQWFFTAMEAMCEDEGSLGNISQPTDWRVKNCGTEQPFTHDKIRRLLLRLDRRGERPTPGGYANRLGIEFER